MNKLKWHKDIAAIGITIGVLALIVELVGYVLLNQYDTFEKLFGIDVLRFVLGVLLVILPFILLTKIERRTE